MLSLFILELENLGEGELTESEQIYFMDHDKEIGTRPDVMENS